MTNDNFTSPIGSGTGTYWFSPPFYAPWPSRCPGCGRCQHCGGQPSYGPYITWGSTGSATTSVTTTADFKAQLDALSNTTEGKIESK